MIEIITDPDAFFRRETGEPSTLGPVAVVLVSGLVALGAVIPTTQLISQAVPDGGSVVATAATAGGAIAAIVGPFVVWLLYTAAFYVISLVFEGEGGFVSLLKLVGWGFVPQILGAAVNAAAAFYAVSNIDPPSGSAEVGSAVAQFQNSPTMMAATVFGIVITVWQGFLWTFAVKHGRNLDLRSAALTVAGPVLVGILLRTNQLL
jgi:hypothetical protein